MKPRRVSVGVALALLVVVGIGPFVAEVTAQPASRTALTAALFERHSVDVGGLPLSLDKAIYRGELRSDKAPGQPLFAVPFYAMYRAVGGESYARLRATRNLGVWWLTLWSSVVPLAMLALLLHRLVSSFDRRRATAVVLALLGGSLLLIFGAQLYGHVLAALAGFGAWLLVRTAPEVSTRAVIGAGALSGFAVLTEYQAVVVAIAVFVFVCLALRARALWFAVGAAPLVGVFTWYHAAAFGAPWHLPFRYFAKELAAAGAPSGGVVFAGGRPAFETLVGHHGLFTVTPVVLLGLAGACTGVRDLDRVMRRECAMALVVNAAIITLAAAWSGSEALEVPGPRYVIPALPFLAVPLLRVWRRLPLLGGAAALWGSAAMLLGVLTPHILAPEAWPIGRYATNAWHHHFVPSVWTMAFGDGVGVTLHVVTVLSAIVLLHHAHSQQATADMTM